MKKLLVFVFLLLNFASCSRYETEDFSKEKNLSSLRKEISLSKELDDLTEKKDLRKGDENVSKTKVENSINYKSNNGLKVENNEIFYEGKKRGYLVDNKIFIEFKENVYSFNFQNDFDNLTLYDMNSVFQNIIWYQSLNINLPEEMDIKILYKCTSPLIRGNSYEYCETNGEDYLVQYEFGGMYRQFGTGGGHFESWKKIFIKKIDNKNIIFEGFLEGSSLSTDTSFITYDAVNIYKSLLKYNLIEDLNLNNELENERTDKSFAKFNEVLEPVYAKMRRIVESKKYLDKVKNDHINLEKEEKWQKTIDSFSLEKTEKD